MAVYEVVGSDGATYRVEGPAGVSKAALARAVAEQIASEEELERDEQALRESQARLIEARYDTKADEDIGFFENIATGFGAGAVDVGEMAALGGAALLDEEAETAAREQIQSIAESIRPEGGEEEAITYNLAKALGSIAGIAAPAALAGMAAPAVAATAVGTGVAGLLAAGAGAGEASERARAAGATEEQRSAATLRGVPIGLLDVLPMGRFLKVVDIPVLTKIINKVGGENIETIGDKFTSVLGTAGFEGAQEAASGLLQNLNQAGYISWEEVDLYSGIAEEAGYGAGAGGIIQMLVDFKRGRTRAKAKKEGDEEPTNEEVVAQLQEDMLLEQQTRESFRPALQRAAQGQEAIIEEETPLLTQLEKRKAARALPPVRETEETQLLQELRELEELPAREAAEATAQQDARERAGLEQPDLFALEQEQEARRLGTPRFPVDQFMDTAEDAEVAAPVAPEEQGDLLTGIEQDRVAAGQERTIREQERAITEQERASAQLRAELAEDPTQMSAAFEEVLAGREGQQAAEQAQADLLQRNLARQQEQQLEADLAENQRAQEQIVEDPATVGEPVPLVEPVQDSFPFMGAPTEQKQRDARRAALEAERLSAPDPGEISDELSPVSMLQMFLDSKIITKEILDLLGVSDGAAIRKRITGKVLDDAPTEPVRQTVDAEQKRKKDKIEDTPRQQLATFAGLKSTQLNVKSKINRFLSDSPGAQMDIFETKPGAPRPRKPQEPGPEGLGAPDTGEVAVPEQLQPITPEPLAPLPTMEEAAPAAAPVVEEEVTPVAPEAAPVVEPKVEVKPKAKAKPAVRKVGKEVTPEEARAEIEAAEENIYETWAAQFEDQSVLVPDARDPYGRGEVKSGEPVRQGISRPRVISLNRMDWEVTDGFRQKIKKLLTKKFTQDKNIIADEKKALAGKELKHQGRHKLSKEELIENGNARAAQIYFSRAPGKPDVALQRLAFEISLPPLNAKGNVVPYQVLEGDHQDTKDHYKGTDADTAGYAASWVQGNLDSTTVKLFDDLGMAYQVLATRAIRAEADTTDIDHVTGSREQVERFIEQQLKARREAIAREDKLNLEELSASVINNRRAESNRDYLYPDAVAGLDIPIHPVIGQLLGEGKLQAALQALRTSAQTGRVRQIAGVLAEVVGDTKVEVRSYVTDDVGNPVVGFFDPKINTIVLDAETGIHSHAILHEMTHAAVSHTLDNKSHPLTKQLTALFNDVKGSLDTAYGATNVHEFVSEAFSNPEFQQKLAGINPKGEPINALQRFFHSVRNFLRRLMGMPTKSLPEHLGSAYVAVDGLINAMLATAPKHRGAGAYYMASISGGVWNVINSAVAKAKGVNSSDEAKASWVNVVLKKMDDARLDKSVTGKSATYYALYRVLPLQAVVDFAVRRGLGKQAIKLQASIENFAGAVGKADQRVDGTAKIFADWIKINKNDKKVITDFNEVVYESTVEQVDPSEPEKTYAGDAKKLKTWKGMQKAWGRLKKNGGDEVYMELRDSYKRLYVDLQGVVESNIDELVTDEAARVELKRTVFTQMFEKNNISPYFPLHRKGDFWVRYDAYDAETDTTEPVYEAYEHVSDRDRRIEELEKDDRVVTLKDGKTKAINEYVNLEQISFANAPSGSFMQRVFETLEKSQPELKKGASEVERGAHAQKAKAHEDTKTQLMRLFINTLPETAFAKSMQKRGGPDNKGFRGFDRDSYDAFITRAYNLARQIEQLRYGNEIRSIEAEMREEFEKIKQKRDVNSHGVKLIVEELERRAMFARSPPNTFADKAAAQANRFAFLGTIGFNISSAIVNASQIPLMMLPILNGEYSQGKYGLGDRAAGAAIGRASSLIAGSTHLFRPGKRLSRKMSRIDAERGNIDVRGTPSIDNFYEADAKGKLIIRTDLNLSKKKIADLTRLKMLVEIAGNRGMLNRSLFYDTLSLEKSGRQRGLWDKVNAGSAFFFHLTERYNRQVAMIATYDLELQRMREQGRDVSSADVQTEAANVALRRAQEMNGGATLSTAPGVAQRGFGRVAMMYKSYGVQMYYTLLKTGYQAYVPATDKWLAAERGMTVKEFQALDKTKKAEIRAEDVELTRKAKEQFIGVLLSSAFLAGVQGMPFVGAVLMMANLFRDEDEDDAETMLRKHIGELSYKGPVTAVLNTDISSRIGLSNLLYRDNPYSNDESPADRLMAVAGGPFWSVGAGFIRGARDVHRGHIERGMEGMLPAAFRNIYKASIRYPSDEGILTRRGDIIHGDLGLGGLAAQFIGFPPTDYTLKQEQAQAFKRIDREVTDKSRRLRKLYYVALRMGDDPSDVLEEIYAFNKKHPTAGITVGSLAKSVEAHKRTSLLMHNGVVLSPTRRREIFESLSEYWPG